MVFDNPPTRSGVTALSLSVEATVAGLVLRVRGDLDMDTAHLLVDLVDDLVASHTPLNLTVDLQHLDFLGAAGITALLEVRDTVAGHGGHLLLYVPAVQAMWVLTIAGVTGAFEIER